MIKCRLSQPSPKPSRQRRVKEIKTPESLTMQLVYKEQQSELTRAQLRRAFSQLKAAGFTRPGESMLELLCRLAYSIGLGVDWVQFQFKCQGRTRLKGVFVISRLPSLWTANL